MTPSEELCKDHKGIKEEVRLILVSTKANSNKFWNAYLCNDDTIIVQNGRVGGAGQTRAVAAKGAKGLAKLILEKEGKGYTRQKVLAAVVSSGTKIAPAQDKSKLIEVAKKEILVSATKKNDYLEEIITLLVQDNVHNVISSTSITYDDTSGVFSTPLGVLTPHAIIEARDLLVQIHAMMCTNKDYTSLADQYLRIVPQKVGSKLSPSALFGTSEKINFQMKTLDSLEESIKTLERRKAAAAADDSEPDKTELTLFPVTMDLEDDAKELKWINKFYDSTKNVKSTGNGLKLANVFRLHLHDSRKAFTEKGKPIGNINRLWHGTSSANLLSILQNGLKTSPPATAKIAGKAFGHGIYFSDIATKSLGYASGAWGNYGSRRRCFMLLNNVAMGKPFKPGKSYSNHSWPKQGFDSTFAEGGTVFINNEMIVYQNYQADPTHLVEFIS